MKTIVAISTPVGNGGISVIRLSGPESFSIAKKMIKKINAKDEKFEMRKMYLCQITTDTLKDIGLVVFFKNPESFTGEDIAEFQVHGGVFLANEIVKQCLKLGAKMAEPGEFSKRAFLNGKMSLEKCEGVIDLINSQSQMQAQTAFNLASGKFYKMVVSLQEKLKNTLAQINVSLDYPDEDLEVDDSPEIAQKLEQIKNEIDKQLESYSRGKLIKHGINVAIIGLPNAGKSSLLNALLNEERAIVSSIAGTTRDVIRESFLINGQQVNLIDTAGINNASDEIEKIGVKRAVDEAEKADLILYLFDGTKPFSAEDEKLISSFKNRNILLVKNKSDVGVKIKNKIEKQFDTVEISAKNFENIDELKNKIYNKFFENETKNTSLIITNERHFNALRKASKNIEECLNLKTSFQSLDIISSLVQSAYNHLGEITGEVGSEKVIDEIFSKFCLGK